MIDRGGIDAGPVTDRGGVETSVQLLVAMLCFLAVLLGVMEATAYWHARNVLADAAAEGARAAAAFDGTCDLAERAATSDAMRLAPGWVRDGFAVGCADDGAVVTVTVTAVTPGVLGRVAGWTATATVTQPKER